MPQELGAERKRTSFKAVANVVLAMRRFSSAWGREGAGSRFSSAWGGSLSLLCGCLGVWGLGISMYPLRRARSPRARAASSAGLPADSLNPTYTYGKRPSSSGGATSKTVREGWGGGVGAEAGGRALGRALGQAATLSRKHAAFFTHLCASPCS